MPADVDQGYRWWNYKGEFIDIKARPFNARGDGSTNDTWAFQQAAVTGYPILMPTGTYVVTESISRLTSGGVGLKLHGHGTERSIFDWRGGASPLFNLNGSVGLDVYARGLHLSDFAIQPTAAATGGRGMDLKGQWQGTVERLWIEGLDGDAVRVANDSGDHDSTANLKFINIHALSNAGWGFDVANPASTTNASGAITLDGCILDRNVLGGARLMGQYFRIVNSYLGIAGTGASAVGLQIPYHSSGTCCLVVVENTEFQDCTDYLIDLQAACVVDLKNIKLIASGTLAPVLVRIGDGASGQVLLGTITGAFVRRDSGTHTCFQFTSTSSNCKLDGLYAPVTTGLTNYTDAGASNAFSRILF